MTVYTDGSAKNNGDQNAAAEYEVWFGDGHPLNISARVPGPNQSNQMGEILAVRAAAMAAPPHALLEIVTDSRYVLEGLTSHLRIWEDKG